MVVIAHLQGLSSMPSLLGYAATASNPPHKLHRVVGHHLQVVYVGLH